MQTRKPAPREMLLFFFFAVHVYVFLEGGYKFMFMLTLLGLEQVIADVKDIK